MDATNITLTSVPGMPFIMVDLDNMEAYSCKKGYLRKLKPSNFFGKLTIHTVGSEVVGTTIYRLAYCAQKGIDHSKIPSNFCISYKDGAFCVREKKDITKEATKASVENRKISADEALKTIILIKESISDPVKKHELLMTVQSYRPKIKKYLRYTFGFSYERCEMFAEMAEEKLMNKLDQEYPVLSLFHYLKKTARGIVKDHRERRVTYYSNGRPTKRNADYF